MTSNSHRFGLVLVFSLFAGLFSHSVLSWASQMSDDAPQWCKNAKTKVEKLICGDENAVDHDQELGVYYKTLLKMVEPSAKSDLVQSQKRWIAEREQCGTTSKLPDVLGNCVSTKIQQRSELLRKDIAERNSKERLSEFNKFALRTFTSNAFEFQYPRSWQKTTEDGRISLKSQGEEMILGFDKTVKSPNQCTYSEGREFYSGKQQIGGKEFENFSRGWLPSGHDEHYYRFFNGRCFAIEVSDNSERPNCYHGGPGEHEATCVIGELEAKDLMAYSDAVMRTVRFLSDKK
jgi:uncharacterized protein